MQSWRLTLDRVFWLLALVSKCRRIRWGVARWTGFLCFNKRTDGCKLAATLIDYEQLAILGFGRKIGFNKGTCR